MVRSSAVTATFTSLHRQVSPGSILRIRPAALYLITAGALQTEVPLLILNSLRLRKTHSSFAAKSTVTIYIQEMKTIRPLRSSSLQKLTRTLTQASIFSSSIPYTVIRMTRSLMPSSSSTSQTASTSSKYQTVIQSLMMPIIRISTAMTITRASSLKLMPT